VAARDGVGGATSTTPEDELRARIERALPGTRSDTTRQLAETARIRSVRTDDTIFPQGEILPLTLVLGGHGAFRRTTVDGQRLIVGVSYPGDLIGFSSIASVASGVDFIALTNGDVAVWRGPDIRQLVAADPGFALDVIDRMSGFLMVIVEKVDGFLHQDARRRVARILVRHGDLFFSDPAILSRAQLPSLVGTSREMTGRVLRELEREGTLTRVGRSGLKLLRPDRLHADAAHLAKDKP
jgi:CRP-like cAMP-binding protein